jgi:hypothetical protein
MHYTGYQLLTYPTTEVDSSLFFAQLAVIAMHRRTSRWCSFAAGSPWPVP